MHPLNSPTFMLAAVGALMAGIVATGTPTPRGDLGLAASAAAVPLDLGCRWSSDAGRVSLTLVHEGGVALEPGTRLVWSTLGTPAPHSGTARLGDAMAPGQELVLTGPAGVAAAGCRAVAWR